MAPNSNQRNSQDHPSSGHRMTEQQRQAKQRKKVIIFSVEIVVILAMVAVLYVVMTKTNSKGPSYTIIEPDNLAIPDKIIKEKEEGTMKGYMNIALFGVDAKTDTQLYKGSNSDCIMIASINMETGDIRLVSVYRDTLLNIGNDEYYKCNSAYQRGGAEQAIKMLNMNLDMDITNFVTVGYKALIKVVDGLGGIYLDLNADEVVHLNNYQKTIVADVTHGDYTPVEEPGYQKLNGLQVAAYCRIRYGGGDDFKRTARQRTVIKALEEQAKKADLATLTKVFNDAIEDVFTNLDSQDILDLLANITKYRIVEEGGFPDESLRTTGKLGARGDCIIPTDLEENVIWLHQFLFEDKDYNVSSNVSEYSGEVNTIASKYK